MGMTVMLNMLFVFAHRPEAPRNIGLLWTEEGVPRDIMTRNTAMIVRPQQMDYLGER